MEEDLKKAQEDLKLLERQMYMVHGVISYLTKKIAENKEKVDGN